MEDFASPQLALINLGFLLSREVEMAAWCQYCSLVLLSGTWAICLMFLFFPAATVSLDARMRWRLIAQLSAEIRTSSLWYTLKWILYWLYHTTFSVLYSHHCWHLKWSLMVYYCLLDHLQWWNQKQKMRKTQDMSSVLLY